MQLSPELEAKLESAAQNEAKSPVILEYGLPNRFQTMLDFLRTANEDAPLPLSVLESKGTLVLVLDHAFVKQVFPLLRDGYPSFPERTDPAHFKAVSLKDQTDRRQEALLREGWIYHRRRREGVRADEAHEYVTHPDLLPVTAQVRKGKVTADLLADGLFVHDDSLTAGALAKMLESPIIVSAFMSYPEERVEIAANSKKPGAGRGQ